MKQVTVELGGSEYTITPLTMRKSREWRQQLDAPIARMIESFRMFQVVEVSDLNAIGQLLDNLRGVALGSVDLCAEAVFSYSPELEAARDEIEEIAYDDEIVAAFVEVVKLAYPFGAMFGMLNGLSGRATSKN